MIWNICNPIFFWLQNSRARTLLFNELENIDPFEVLKEGRQFSEERIHGREARIEEFPGQFSMWEIVIGCPQRQKGRSMCV